MSERCQNQEYQMAQVQAGQKTITQYPITDWLVLASQPDSNDWACLIKNGFNTILNIRQDPNIAAQQAQQARAVGLNYIHLPLPAYELEPEHVTQFNRVISRPGLGKVLFHCRSASRTGLVWLLKRTEIDGWSPEEAQSELRAAGYDEDNIDVFEFCAEDYRERTISTELHLMAA